MRIQKGAPSRVRSFLFLASPGVRQGEGVPGLVLVIVVVVEPGGVGGHVDGPEQGVEGQNAQIPQPVFFISGAAKI